MRGCADVEPVRGRARLRTRPEPFNSTPMAVNSISSGSPHVRGEPDEIKKIKKNTRPKNITALVREQAHAGDPFGQFKWLKTE